MHVYFTNLGCKLNQAEVEALARRFVAGGYVLAATLEEADLHVVNSCTVTHLAARDSRKVARRGARTRPGIRTVLTGCYATADPEEAGALQGVDLVVPNSRKEDLFDLVHEAFPASASESPAAPSQASPYLPLGLGHSRAQVKVEDGCDMRCSFCIIPETRGRQRSRPLEEVVEEVRGLTEAGHPEVVLTGVQISEYRDGERRLRQLVEAILRDVPKARLRLTSLAPWRFDDRLLELFRDRRLCRHLHLSLQSGCTATLRRMRRPYRAAGYAALVDKVRAAIPGVAVTTDVIVGFPGETDEEHQESLAFVSRMAFARVHVFSFSARPGTAAASLSAGVPARRKKARVREMLEVARRSELAFRRTQLGERLEVAWEGRREGVWRGLSDNYVRVYSGHGGEPRWRRSEVRLQRIHGDGVWAGPPVEPARPRLPL